MVTGKRSGERGEGPEEVNADLWLSNWDRGGTLVEDARHLSSWDQTLSLLWFEDDDVRAQGPERRLTFERDGLTELDGILPWPGKRTRR